MKILKDYAFNVPQSITASSQNTNFPVSNLYLLDPGVVWRAGDFTGDTDIVIDFGAAVDIDNVWLCAANFIECTIQANSTNSWDSPAVTKTVTLAKDAVGILKGFFVLSAPQYRYVRLLINQQALLFGTAPQLGNIIIGKAYEQPVAELAVSYEEMWLRFESDGGAHTKARKGRGRHIIDITITGPEAEVSAARFSDCELMVVYTDLSSVADSYLVYAPERGRIVKRSPLEAEVSYTLEERT